MQLSFMGFEAAFYSSHRGRLLISTICLITEEGSGSIRLFNFAIDNIMRRIVDQCPADIIIAPTYLSENHVNSQAYLFAVRPIMMVCPSQDLHKEFDVMYRRMIRGRYQHFAPPSKMATENRLSFFGYIMRRPGDRLVQRVQRSRLQSGKGHLDENGSFGLRRIKTNRNSDEWIDSVQALAQDQDDWAKSCREAAAERAAGSLFSISATKVHLKATVDGCGTWWSAALTSLANEALTKAITPKR
ncbi:hypothetical protein RB195_007044 [Necator americanus]|uniref:Uncharacterized protein n=1 Tax=Necator americanus TaxID=51031 RepID=A0ABR1BY89_NECAM